VQSRGRRLRSHPHIDYPFRGQVIDSPSIDGYIDRFPEGMRAGKVHEVGLFVARGGPALVPPR